MCWSMIVYCDSAYSTAAELRRWAPVFSLQIQKEVVRKLEQKQQQQ
jgi:hypothetical protein